MKVTMEPEVIYKPGEIIVPRMVPFVKVLNEAEKGNYCDCCFKSCKTQQCTGCQKMHYCSKKCQKRDWKDGHSVECKSNVFKNPLKFIPMLSIVGHEIYGPLRILAKYHKNPSSFDAKHLIYGSIERSFNDLLISKENVFRVWRDSQNMSDFISQFYKYLKKDPSYKLVDFDEELLWRVMGLWATHVNPLWTIGSGIYIPLSFIKHACRQNAYPVANKLDKVQMSIRCIHPILKGEEVTISMVINEKPDGVGNVLGLCLNERQAVLRQHYIFSCKCGLCLAEGPGPLISYKRFKTLQDLLESQETFPYQRIIEFRDELVGMLRKLYYEYDNRLVAVGFMVVGSLVASHLKWENVPPNYIADEVKELERRIKVTYGMDSDFYVRFKEDYGSILDNQIEPNSN